MSDMSIDLDFEEDYDNRANRNMILENLNEMKCVRKALEAE